MPDKRPLVQKVSVVLNPKIPLSGTKTLQFRAVAQHAHLRFRINLNTAETSTEGREVQTQTAASTTWSSAKLLNANGQGVGCVIAWRGGPYLVCRQNCVTFFEEASTPQQGETFGVAHLLPRHSLGHLPVAAPTAPVASATDGFITRPTAGPPPVAGQFGL